MNDKASSDRSAETTAPLRLGEALETWEITEWKTEGPPYIQMATPNATQYPNVAGTDRLSRTTPAQGSRLDENVRRRSWMGWFLWGDGVRPPDSANATNWDFFSFQYPANVERQRGVWKAIRMDQQPLYLNPLRLNYAWPPGKFGFKQQPLQTFGRDVSYWKDKKIVRGINLSMPFPYLCNFGDFNAKLPAPWQNVFLTLESKPLETLVLVPSNKMPQELLTPGPWNTDAAQQPEPFPYPVWDGERPASQQTPWNIKVDRMGDWDADLVWEATNPDDPQYESNRYSPTAWADPGRGKYLKMTVAQGSPYVWCETHGTRYSIFYNLIRTNEAEHINNACGTPPTNPRVLGPYAVPAAPGVEFVLLCGNQTNPNQFYHEVPPKYFDALEKKAGGWNPAGAQSNHTYVAVFYNKARVHAVQLGHEADVSNGTDDHGNPYWYLTFKEDKKNWFVVAPVPVMHYYEGKEDSVGKRDQAALNYAQELGKYAFNFITSTKITYQVENMYRVTTAFEATVANPYQQVGMSEAATLVADPSSTVFALLPHHYQPIPLGPNPLTGEEVVWRPLVEGTHRPFPADSVPFDIPLANSGKWGYWSMRGNHKTIVGNTFQTQYLFQNFLPVAPPPAWEKTYEHSGVQAVHITDGGSGYTKIAVDDVRPPAVTLSPPTSTDPDQVKETATAHAVLVPHSGEVQHIVVDKPGRGYEDGKVTVTISPPQTLGGTPATARAQLARGQVIAIHMENRGSGYIDAIELIPHPDDTARTEISKTIITPEFNATGTALCTTQEAERQVHIWQGGAGYTHRPTVQVRGTGTGAHAEVVMGGEVSVIVPSGTGGFTDKGAYPYIDHDASGANTMAGITVHIPPSANPAQTTATAEVAALEFDEMIFSPLYIEDPGAGYDPNDPPTGVLHNKDKQSIPIFLAIEPGEGFIFNADLRGDNALWCLREPTDAILRGGKAPTRPAVIRAYPQAHIKHLRVTKRGTHYTSAPEVRYGGGHVGLTSQPALDFTIQPDGSIKLNGGGLHPGGEGAGFVNGTRIEIHGGKGWEAEAYLYRSHDGRILAVEMLRAGSNYPPDTRIQFKPEGQIQAQCTLLINAQGGIEKVQVNSPGAGYPSDATAHFVRPDGTDAKGEVTEIIAGPANRKERGGLTGLVLSKPGARYLPGSEKGDSALSPQAVPVFFGGGPVFANNARRFIAQTVNATCTIGSVLYDALTNQYLNLALESGAPFGAGFKATSPDAYGMGGALSAATKGLGLLYCLSAANSTTDRAPWTVSRPVLAKAQGAATAVENGYAHRAYEDNLPFVTLRGALRTWTQALQHTLSLYFRQEPYRNTPQPFDWKLKYFAQYDQRAQRVVINPTGGNPAMGINSATNNPPPPEEANAVNGQKKNAPWHPGEMWSGFFVSDQMNDQHYFFGYYLTTAGILAILDRSWEPALQGKPDRLWADQEQMGTAIDQLVMTLAYDPALHDAFYSKPELRYPKMAFFDQWSGHGWATGAQPGRDGEIMRAGRRNDAWSEFDMSGTGSWLMDGMNENSNWEGNQAWAGIVLWGAGTGRKRIADLGIYLLATGAHAGDVYFYDKNYNLKASAENVYSWVPVTTANQPHDKQGNSYPKGSSVVDAAKDFAGDASCGNSTLYYGTNSLTNFFYAYPTGSKFIQGYPVTPWTMGMSRNTAYMTRWADSLFTPAWKTILPTPLFDAGDFLGIAMGSALAGAAYFPGDSDKSLPLLNRLLSSWVTAEAAPGEQATMQPTDKPTSVLHLLHVLEHYGTPDWTVYAKNVDATGQQEIDTMVFTAAFVKRDEAQAQVRMSYVAFNPGWETAYVHFYRLHADGTLPNGTPLTGDAPLAVKPKAMVVKTVAYTI